MTEQALIKIPDREGVFYRTGDLVRLDPLTKLLYYIGRKDFQIKLRGQRIECGEIEHVLCQFSFSPSCSNDTNVNHKTKQAIITKCEYLNLEHLVAYVHIPTFEEKETDNKDIQHQLRLHCEKYLPLHMIPSFFVILDQFPLNNNGKVNRKALPLPNFSEIIDQNQDNTIVAPRTDTEHQVLAIWKEYLNINNISVTSNFFTLGGNSLLLMQAIRRYHEIFAYKYRASIMTEFYQTATICEHARQLDTYRKVENLDEECMKLEEWKPHNLTEGPASLAQERIFTDQYMRFSLNEDVAVTNFLYILQVKGT